MRNRIRDIEKDRRMAERIPVSIKIQYRLPRERSPREALAQNVSGTGMRIKSDMPFKKGGRLRSLVYFPEEQSPVSVTDRVVWCRKREEGEKAYFDVGIRHEKIEPSDKERFVFLFCDTMINMHTAIEEGEDKSSR